MIRPLDRKLLRDIWTLKGQALAISLVIGAGVAMFVMYLSTFHSLRLTQQTYYERYRFAHVFAALTRAPLSLRDRAAEIPAILLHHIIGALLILLDAVHRADRRAVAALGADLDFVHARGREVRFDDERRHLRVAGAEQVQRAGHPAGITAGTFGMISI